MRKKHFAGVLLVLAVIVCLLCGCEQPVEETTVPTVATTSKYTVDFMLDGELYYTMEVEPGSMLPEVKPEAEGKVFYAWFNEEGEETDLQRIAVYSDRVFYGNMFPDITAHEPFLFADKNGFLRPDELLTADEMKIAITVLTEKGAEPFIPELPEGTQHVKVAQLKQFLKKMFPAITVEQLMTILDSDTITRSEFALILSALLGRLEEAVIIEDDRLLPYDVSAEREDISVVLEAYLHHTHGEGEQPWEELAAERKNAPGFFNADGWLYCVDENGELVRDAQVGVLTFDADGRYTSGDAELDVMVAEILAKIIADNPDTERIDLLRKAFEYSRDSFSYLRRNAYYFGQTGWEIEDAKKMITTGRGNCYSYAAVFWALGRGLGYETIGISGTMTKTDQPHSWVEIYFDGEPFVFDPEMEMVYRFERDIFDKDMFMVDYEAGKYWNYKRP